MLQKSLSRVLTELGITYKITPYESWGSTFYILSPSKKVQIDAIGWRENQATGWRDLYPAGYGPKFLNPAECISQFALDLSNCTSTTGTIFTKRYSYNRGYTIVP